MPAKNIAKEFRNAQLHGAPLVSITTADPFRVMEKIGDALNGTVARFAWNAAQGVRAASEKALAFLRSLAGESVRTEEQFAEWLKQFAASTMNVNSALDFALTIPDGSVIFFLHFHRFIADPVTVTAFHILREPFKATQRVAVPLGPSFSWPEEVRRDVVTLDDPLPDTEDLGAMVKKLYTETNLGEPVNLMEVVDAARGLSAFEAETAVAMALTPKGVDVPSAWRRKTENVPRGLSVTVGEKPQKVAGLKQVLRRIELLFAGKNPPAAVLRLDEFEKMKGSENDSTNISQDAEGAVLQWMEDSGHTGIICLGPAGTGKSFISKIIAMLYRVPGMSLDMGKVKEKWAGASENNLRDALKAADAMAGGRRVLVVATCNKITNISAPLRRRFRAGTYYFDLTSREERIEAWKLYVEKYEIKESFEPFVELPLTPAEIRNACEDVYDNGITLREAVQFLTPIAIADPKSIEDLRNLADGAFLNASEPGPYRKPGSAQAKAWEAVSARKLDVS